MMKRRKYLATISSTVGGLALAGCSTDEGGGDGGDGGDSDDDEDNSGGNGDSTETPTVENPASELEVVGLLTADQERNMWQAEVDAGNPTQQSVTAEFSAALSPTGGGSDVTSDTVEQTIPSGEREQFLVDIVDPSELPFENFTSIYFEGFQFQILVNGEPKPNICPEDGGPLASNSQEGCEYTYGLSRTYVEVEYSGNWQGSFGTEDGQRSVSRGSGPYTAPEGYDTSYVDVSDDASIVSANAQKQDDSSEELTIRVIHEGEVVAEQSTSSAYGVAQVSANI